MPRAGSDQPRRRTPGSRAHGSDNGSHPSAHSHRRRACRQCRKSLNLYGFTGKAKEPLQESLHCSGELAPAVRRRLVFAFCVRLTTTTVRGALCSFSCEPSPAGSFLQPPTLFGSHPVRPGGFCLDQERPLSPSLVGALLKRTGSNLSSFWKVREVRIGCRV